MLSRINSLPPVYLGQPEVEWCAVPKDIDTFFEGEVEEVKKSNPLMKNVVDLAVEDAQKTLKTDVIDLGLRIRSGNKMPSDLIGEMCSRKFRKAGAWHVDEIEGRNATDELVYFLSNRVSTEHALGKFTIFGQNNRLLTILSPLLIAPQIKCSLQIQVASGELIRTNGEAVHRSPCRGVPPNEQQDILVAAYARVAS